jgi:hypothetical protein
LRVPQKSWIGLRVTRGFGRFGRVDSRVPPESLCEGAAGNPHKRDGLRRLNSGAISTVRPQNSPGGTEVTSSMSDFVGHKAPGFPGPETVRIGSSHSEPAKFARIVIGRNYEFGLRTVLTLLGRRANTVDWLTNIVL